jgi:predicted O-linked N-acetylglucosamine transferase (SPINDLY family)
LPDLVFANSDDFVREAVAIAKDPERLRDYRARLAATRDHCTLFDIDEHVRRLEELYEEMWRDHLAGALPRPDLKLLETDLSVRDAMDRSQTL